MFHNESSPVLSLTVKSVISSRKQNNQLNKSPRSVNADSLSGALLAPSVFAVNTILISLGETDSDSHSLLFSTSTPPPNPRPATLRHSARPGLAGAPPPPPSLLIVHRTLEIFNLESIHPAEDTDSTVGPVTHLGRGWRWWRWWSWCSTGRRGCWRGDQVSCY